MIIPQKSVQLAFVAWIFLACKRWGTLVAHIHWQWLSSIKPKPSFACCSQFHRTIGIHSLPSISTSNVLNWYFQTTGYIDRGVLGFPLSSSSKRSQTKRKNNLGTEVTSLVLMAGAQLGVLLSCEPTPFFIGRNGLEFLCEVQVRRRITDVDVIWTKAVILAIVFQMWRQVEGGGKAPI